MRETKCLLQSRHTTTRALAPCVPALGFVSYFVSIDAACALGERLRSAISDDTFDVGIPPPIKITVSVGVSEFGCDGDTLASFWVSPISSFTARNAKAVIA